MKFIHPDLLGDEKAFSEKCMHPVKQGKYANSTYTEKIHHRKALEVNLRLVILYHCLRKSFTLLKFFVHTDIALVLYRT